MWIGHVPGYHLCKFIVPVSLFLLIMILPRKNNVVPQFLTTATAGDGAQVSADVLPVLLSFLLDAALDECCIYLPSPLRGTGARSDEANGNVNTEAGLNLTIKTRTPQDQEHCTSSSVANSGQEYRLRMNDSRLLMGQGHCTSCSVGKSDQETRRRINDSRLLMVQTHLQSRPALLLSQLQPNNFFHSCQITQQREAMAEAAAGAVSVGPEDARRRPRGLSPTGHRVDPNLSGRLTAPYQQVQTRLQPRPALPVSQLQPNNSFQLCQITQQQSAMVEDAAGENGQEREVEEETTKRSESNCSSGDSARLPAASTCPSPTVSESPVWTCSAASTALLRSPSPVKNEDCSKGHGARLTEASICPSPTVSESPVWSSAAATALLASPSPVENEDSSREGSARLAEASACPSPSVSVSESQSPLPSSVVEGSAVLDDRSFGELLRESKHATPLTFDALLEEIGADGCVKLHEGGVYSEVFRICGTRGVAVLKVVHINYFQGRLQHLLTEVRVTRMLREINMNVEHNSSGFSELRAVYCVRDKYPDMMRTACINYYSRKNFSLFSDEERDISRSYVVFYMSYAGRPLSKVQFDSALQIRSVVQQLALSIAIGEAALELEHRALTPSHVLVKAADEQVAHFWLDGRPLLIDMYGVQVTLVDFSTARIRAPAEDSQALFAELAEMPEEKWTSLGDFFATVYRGI
ncbi:hypothetical protein MTO96_028703, partial [Rhipicephalus appendiculatus]